jgi:hypothetical protein
VVASILRPGTAAPEPIAWVEVGERVLASQWMGLQRRTAGCVDGATIASLPALAADGERIGASAVAALGGDGTTPEHARRMAADVLAASLALALRDAGWAVKSRPGAPVELRRGDARLEPFREVARLVQGERTASSWREDCTRLGFEDLPLVAERGTPAAAVPDVAVPLTWTLLSSRCTKGWTHWCHGELWLSTSGLLWRRLGWRRTILQGLVRGAHAGRGQRALLTDRDLERVVGVHRSKPADPAGGDRCRVRSPRYHHGPPRPTTGWRRAGEAALGDVGSCRPAAPRGALGLAGRRPGRAPTAVTRTR